MIFPAKDFREFVTQSFYFNFSLKPSGVQVSRVNKMNNASNRPMLVQDSPDYKIIPAKVNELLNISDTVNGPIVGEILSLISRISDIGKRLAPNGHPDNIPQPSNGNTVGKSEAPIKPPIDGISGTLQDVINGNVKFLDNWNGNLCPEIIKYIAYIELHI